MSRHRPTVTRRRLLQTAALGAASFGGILAAPAVLRAQGTAVKVGVLVAVFVAVGVPLFVAV